MHSTSENARATITVIGIISMNVPINPGININGRKATHVVVTAATTGISTLRVPVTAAAIGCSPNSIFL